MDFNPLCPGITDTMEIEVPTLPDVFVEIDTLIFEEWPVTVEADTDQDPNDIIWCDADGNPIGTGPSIEVDETVGECVSAKITDEFGCSDTAKVVLILDMMQDPFDDVDGIDGSDTACPNDTFNLELIVEMPENYTYVWGPADCIISDGDTPIPTVSIGDENKQFAVTVTDIEMMIDSVFTFDVSVSNVDVVLECSFDNGVINWGSEGTISVVSPDGTYEWSNGETGSSITIEPTENTTYSVTVTDVNGCTGVASKDVEVNPVNCDEDNMAVFIPNAFSPNDDGVNDIFRLRSDWIEEMEVTTFIVYNRWGEEVYNGEGTLSGWDGRLNGEELAPDVFAYCIKGTCIDGTEFTRVGNVSLLK